MIPEISVVIPAYNRGNILKNTLPSLFNQSLEKDRFELIVVDDGSKDNTAKILKEFSNSTSCQLRMYYQKHSLAGTARNLGVLKARGDIVLLIDSDINANPDLLKLHLMLHLKHPELHVGVFGNVITGNKFIDLCHLDNREITFSGALNPENLLISPDYLTTQNLSLKKQYLMKVGLFKPELPCLQDKELAFRLKQFNFKLIYCSKAIGVHTQPLDTIQKVVASGKKYGFTLAEWYDKIPNFQKEITNIGGRFNGGWTHFVNTPWQYLKDAIRRWLINRRTIHLILVLASKIPISNPPKRILVRCCIEIWAFYYRYTFKERRKQLGLDK